MKAVNGCMGMICLGVWMLPAVAVSPLTPSELAALPDPTRPPLSLVTVAGGGAGLNAAAAASAASSASGASSPSAADTPVNLLTLVRIDAKTGLGVAMLGGRMVAVGDRVGDAVVAGVDASGITLRTARGTRRMSLWGLSNKASETPTAATKGGIKEKP